MTPMEGMLVLLLSLQAPGRSPHARILLSDCDESCQATPVCAEPVMACQAPKWSGRDRAFYRYENWQEGVRRYAMIAETTVTVAAASKRQGRWLGSQDSLERLLATVMAHESGLRRDVHEGRTRGDCDYTTIGGVRRMIEGSCRSHCLGQVQVPPHQGRTPRGYTPDDLVGLDPASTQRCLETVSDVLAGAHKACVAQRNGQLGAHPTCTLGIYGGVASWRSDPRIQKRVKTYRTLAARTRRGAPLPDAVRELLRP
jgi:hypothetical protein